jgi:hypothetical protein
MIAEDFDYYDECQAEIVKGHIGEFVVVKDRRVVGYYKTEEDAFEAMKQYKLGTFMVKVCQEVGDDVAYFYNSLVEFA